MKNSQILLLANLIFVSFSCTRGSSYLTDLSYDPITEKSDALQVIQRMYRYKIVGKDTLKSRIEGADNKIKTFNEKGFKIKESKIDTNDLILSENKYFYNRNNLIKLETCYKEGQFISAEKYRYNNHGNIKQAKSKGRKDKRFKFFFKCTYEYLAKNQRIIQSFTNKFGAYSKKEYFFENGNCHYSISVHQNKNDYKGYSLTEINDFDPAERLVKKVIHSNISRDNVYVIETDSIFFTYNDNGLLEEWTLYENSFTSKQRPVQHLLKRKYFYDDWGRLKRKEKVRYFVITEYEYIYE